jgi:hypothetical protein
MQLQNEISGLSRPNQWLALIRNFLMAVIYPNVPKLRRESYRAERHYMRGPGPKWHAKHGRPPAEKPVR